MGLEPTHLSIPEPKSGASTNSAKGANFITGYIFSAQPIELITHKDNTGFEPATTPLSEENVFAVSILNFGSGGENRTPTNGFGDHRTAIILHRNIQQDAFTFCQTCCHYTNSLLSEESNLVLQVIIVN